MKTKKWLPDSRGQRNDGSFDLLDLWQHLRREHIFVSNERYQLQKLNEKMIISSSRVFNTSYISREQRSNCERLLTHGNSDLLNCCNASNRLESLHFVDSYKKLTANELHISELMSFLRKTPEVLAKCVISIGKVKPEMVENISHIILSTLYSNCILSEDKVFALNLMKHLIVLELSVLPNPRRVLRYNWCAFNHIYRLFCDQILDAKPFLTAALYEPIMQLLAEDDLFLDMDPNRAAVRFAPSERIRHFGKEGTQLYYENLQKYRIWTINKLAHFVTKFIEGIQNNIYCFPHSLSWIIRQLYVIIIENKNIESREVGAICTDLLFGFFICPAILNPDFLGITDAHVSHISRFNLQQIAQIIQMLALSKWEQIDSKLDDLYSKVPKEGIAKLLDQILDKRNDDLPEELNNPQIITKYSVLISEFELKLFVNILNQLNIETVDENIKKMKEILDKIPENFIIESNDKSNVNLNPENSPRNRRSILNRVTKNKGKLTETSITSQNELINNQNKFSDNQLADVLVIPIGSTRDCPGMLSEDKVLKAEQQKRSTKVRLNLDLLLTQNNEETESVVSAVSGSEKRTRFSLSQDQESIGTNLENENDNMSDMVSANVSSGRGTPNVSGRDTPSSHSPNQSSPSSDEEVEDEPMADAVAVPVNIVSSRNNSTFRRLNTIPVTQPNRPANRDDIEDKFGKFDIKPVAAVDETKSMLSDTWSTDVLGSDSEAIEQSDNLTNLQTPGINMLFAGQQSQTLQSILDSSETASQSDAWSTDVLTSDTERLKEFDPDDSVSVTRSEPEEETMSYECNSLIESPKNGTLKQRNVKIGPNLAHFSQDVTDSSGTSTIIRSKSSNSNSLKLINLAKNEIERNSFGDTLVSDNSDHFGDSFSMSLSPTLLSHNMQSLGRLTFDVRKFEEDVNVRSVINDNISKCNVMSTNGSNVSELLSIDLIQKKVTKQINNDLVNSLIDFEMDISNDANQTVKTMESNNMICKMQTEEHSSEQLTVSSDSTFNTSDLSICSTSSTIEIKNVNKQFNHESTGAIPKTLRPIINTSGRHPGYSPNDDELNRHTNRKGFFKFSNFKTTFKDKMRSLKDNKRVSSNDDYYDYDSSKFNQSNADYSINESSDEILAKYRAKSCLMNTTSDESPIKANITTDMLIDEEKNNSLNELEVLEITKRKLRRVLSLIDLITIPALMNHTSNANNRTKVNEIINILKLLRAEAINLRNISHSVLLNETLRSIESLDENTFQKLFWSLKEDYKKRSVYISYLTRCRQQLLSSLAYFDSILQHIEREKSICSRNLISLSVKQFLERKDRSVQLFIKKFQSLIAADEKTQLVDKFMVFLESTLNSDSQWQSATEDQLEMAKQLIERQVMSQIYIHALYPNGDGDVLRDQILHKYIQNLSQTITPNHKHLGIPKIYHSESPWPSAQHEIQAIGAHKTPRDKIKCVVKCCTNIMNLLSLATDRSVPAADDLMPVLVFVLIKANPPSLLSTVQYVSSFYDKHFEGEEAYWWTQFCSAIEFIKTMD
ncbi:GTPase-activating protein and VPS9 domain-containing protein 1-like isoform X2 [Oppia nitens]|uniref:GTPase-activating protein and VPS9 domain-containing protein 1-like isoform X2 n=1 Tax=Oppia nitens TaxID=1686743 RepID=UPI0023DBA14D|nr:GTPase-activating protein and VPS9 domain-containing protein 1-like isoform X2 [Oppia nitens]